MRSCVSACCAKTPLATVLSEHDRWPIIRVLLIHIERQQHEVLMWQRSNLFADSVDQPTATSSASQELNAAMLARCKTYVVQSSKILHPKLFHLTCCKAHDLHLHAWARYHQVHPYTHQVKLTSRMRHCNSLTNRSKQNVPSTLPMSTARALPKLCATRPMQHQASMKSIHKRLPTRCL